METRHPETCRPKTITSRTVARVYVHIYSSMFSSQL